MAVPVLRALLANYPELKITVVSRGFFAPFFAEFKQVEFLAVDLNQRHKGALGLYRLYKDIKATGAEALADFHGVLRSKIVGFYARIFGMPVVQLDKGRKEKKALTQGENKDFRPLKRTVERYATVLRELGFSLDLTQPRFPEKPSLEQEIAQVMGSPENVWIGIAPFAQHQPKVYPMDLMRQVIQGLSERGNINVYIFGAGAKESAMIDELALDLPRVKNMAGALKFPQELKAIANLDAMLSMDSGNAHIAAMYNVPTVTLWGATHPYAGFAPFAQPLENALTADRNRYPLLPTSIYGNKVVEGYQEAMRSIAPEQVIGQLLKVITK